MTLERPFLIFGANTALAGSTVGVITSPEEMSLNIDDDANDDANPKVLAMKQFRKEYKSIVGSVWSSVKVISLALESQQGPSLSKTD